MGNEHGGKKKLSPIEQLQAACKRLPASYKSVVVAPSYMSDLEVASADPHILLSYANYYLQLQQNNQLRDAKGILVREYPQLFVLVLRGGLQAFGRTYWEPFIMDYMSAAHPVYRLAGVGTTTGARGQSGALRADGRLYYLPNHNAQQQNNQYQVADAKQTYQ